MVLTVANQRHFALVGINRNASRSVKPGSNADAVSMTRPISLTARNSVDSSIVHIDFDDARIS